MNQGLCLVVLASWAAVVWAADKSYCDFTPQHTLCKYSGVGPKCGKQMQMQVHGVKDHDAAKIVAKHNQLRSKVAMRQEMRGKPGPQPGATNMRLMEWDGELAQVAQAHADQCVFQHDCSDCRRVARFGVGQNLFISFQSNLDTSVQWERAIQAWYDEVALFSPGHIQPFKFSKGVGHYTQMMWWSTYKIGCGFTMFKESKWWKKLYTCNYGPAGNIISSQMYQTGSPCSSCPDGTTCSLQYPGLCQSAESSGAGTRTPSSTTTPFPVNDDNNKQDNAIINPLNDNNNNGFNVFNGFIDLNNINPRDVDLDTLIRFFNSRRRTTTRTPLPIMLNTVFNRKVVKPALITAAPTTPAASTSTTQSRLPPTASITTAAPTTTMSTSIPTTPRTTTQPPLTTTTSTTTTSPSSTTTSSLQDSAFGSSLTTNQVLVRRTFAPKTLAKTMRPSPADLEQGSEPGDADDEQDATFIPFTGAQPTTSDLMPFLRRAGMNTQIIRTSSLANVHNIIDALPPGHRPIVLFRSGSGQLTELNPKTLVPLQRSSRSTTTRGPGTTPPALLACDLDFLPCEIVPIGGNWTVAESESEGQYMEVTLQEGEGAQVVVQQLVAAPESETVCVTLSHRRALTATYPTDATIPPLQVGVMPLGETITRRPVLGAPGVWEMSRVTLQGVKSMFMLAITVGPASAPATVGLGALMVTNGECCLSGQC